MNVGQELLLLCPWSERNRLPVLADDCVKVVNPPDWVEILIVVKGDFGHIVDIRHAALNDCQRVRPTLRHPIYERINRDGNGRTLILISFFSSIISCLLPYSRYASNR